MKHVLLTGATGFLGSHLLEALLENGYLVTILKRSTSDVWRIAHLLERVKSFDVDVSPIEEAFKLTHVDIVIHTACNYGRKGESEHQLVESNVVFGLRLLDAAIFFKSTIFFNTDTLLPKYLNAYSLSKKQLVEWLKKKSGQVQVINMRLEHMYGPKDDDAKFVSWLITQLSEGVERIPLTEGSQLRDFIYIDDVVSAYMTALSRASSLPTFVELDVGTGYSLSVRDFVQAVFENFKVIRPNTKTILGYGDIPVRNGEVMSVELDNSGLKNIGWRCKVTIKQGIGKLLGEIQ